MAEPTTRERILDVAGDLFVEQGYDGTSLREIADRMGFTKAALYYHFPSKEDLLQALLEPFWGMVQEMGERLSKAQTIEEWAETLEWTIDLAVQHVGMFSLLDRNRAAVRALAEQSEQFQEHELFHQELRGVIERLGTTLEQRVRLVSSMGVVAGFDDFGGTGMMQEHPEEIRAQLVAITRQILGLPKRRPAR